MVITLTDISPEIEAALQRKAAEEGKSLHEVTIDAVKKGLEAETSSQLKVSVNDFEAQRQRATLKPGTKRDLSFIVGTWVEDPEFDAILEEQRRIDPELWQ